MDGTEMSNIGQTHFEYGSGPSPTPGYTTVDVCPHSDIQLVSPEDVFKAVCESGFATEILSVHFIEHFVRSDVMRLVKMWYEMLGSGGRLITGFPDLARMSDDAIAGRKTLLATSISWFLDHTFGAVMPEAQQELYRHRSFWTAAEFTALLREVGFSSVREVPYSRKPHQNAWTTEIWGVKP